ncbi:LOW QUALITY PROTEIN: hypothetical protein PanWU01x14_145520 [Parasponia andersonii]|uniref:HD-Zip IV C-terminal domain-containing protein n=1 Tax=Parasponia andersonii TaxID=3476 RepID=A0A2P5CK67_PARAD|nr:LOW QUALITY PROTEIN: hypothetical protein PanWU01x14_145520 [Parasponia andersonii]
MDILAVSVFNGVNPDYVAILPSGFVILPDVTTMTEGTTSGSLLTVVFHIIDALITLEYIPFRSLVTACHVPHSNRHHKLHQGSFSF